MKHFDQHVSRETTQRLACYEALLRRWQQRINLIANADLDEIWQRHIEDSLQLLAWLPATCEPAIDLGSGAGFPGLILALAGNIPFHLVESDKRKAAFLREAARVTGTPVTVHALRVETAELPRAALVTARALAPLPRLLDLAAGLITETTVCILPKGRGWQNELTEAERGWQMVVERFPSRTDVEGAVLRLSHIKRA